MSLETLLEAARYVEQQELRAKHLQSLLPRMLPSPPGGPTTTTVVSVTSPSSAGFKIVSPVTLAGQQPQLSASPPTALVAVPQVHQVGIGDGGHSLVAPTSTHPLTLVVAPRQPGGTSVMANSQGMVTTTQPSVMELVTKPLPLLNGFDKPTLLISTPSISPPHISHTTSESLIPAIKHLPPPSAPVQPSISPHPLPTSTTSAGVVSKRHITHSTLTGSSVVSSTTSNGTHGPSVMRSGTREVHNKLEKNRRAHLKECFEMLKKQLPPQQDEKKSSNLSILHSALRHIQTLKKRERENEHEMERLAREKIAAQQRLAALKKELGSQWDNLDALLPENGSTTVLHQTIDKFQDFTHFNVFTIPKQLTSLPPATSSSGSPPTLLIKDEPMSSEATARAIHPGPAQLSVLPYHSVGQSLAVVGLHKLALVGGVAKAGVQMVPSPVALIAAPQQLNGKVVPLVNAQYLMKPVVVVSTPSTAATALSPRQS